jgi:hypothetical protein
MADSMRSSSLRAAPNPAQAVRPRDLGLHGSTHRHRGPLQGIGEVVLTDIGLLKSHKGSSRWRS